MNFDKTEWKITEEEYKNICQECRDQDPESSDFGEDCPYYHDCLCEFAQSKLMRLLNANKGEIKDNHVIFPTDWWNELTERIELE